LPGCLVEKCVAPLISNFFQSPSRSVRQHRPQKGFWSLGVFGPSPAFGVRFFFFFASCLFALDLPSADTRPSNMKHPLCLWISHRAHKPMDSDAFFQCVAPGSPPQKFAGLRAPFLILSCAQILGSVSLFFFSFGHLQALHRRSEPVLHHLLLAEGRSGIRFSFFLVISTPPQRPSYFSKM